MYTGWADPPTTIASHTDAPSAEFYSISPHASYTTNTTDASTSYAKNALRPHNTAHDVTNTSKHTIKNKAAKLTYGEAAAAKLTYQSSEAIKNKNKYIRC